MHARWPTTPGATLTGLLRVLAACLLGWLITAPGQARATPGGNVTLDTYYWADAEGKAAIDDVAALPANTLQRMDRPRSFELASGALWLRYELPALDTTDPRKR